MGLRIPMNSVMQAARLLCGRADQASRIAREGQNAYEIRVLRDCNRLATVFEELEHLLNLMGRSRTFQEVRAAIKMYLISWATVWDATANVINEVMQLGVDRRRVSWNVVLEQAPVQRTEIPALAAKHASTLRRQHFVDRRNDIVHRGWLEDSDYDELFGDWLFAVGMASIHHPGNTDSAVRQAAEDSNIQARIGDLVKNKQAQLREHLTATFAALEELGPVLERELRQRCAT
jgi:hypothetical protein